MRNLKCWGLAVLLITVAFWLTISEVKNEKIPPNNTDDFDQSEEIERARLQQFFSKLASIYGFLYKAEDESFQIFIQIDETLLQGELTGSLLMMTKTDSYDETSFVINGITDGHMVQFFTTVDGNKTKMEGNFHLDARSFELSTWAAEHKLLFHAITKEEFKRSYKEYRIKVRRWIVSR